MMVDQPERPCQAFAVAIKECVVLEAKCVIDDLVKNGKGKIVYKDGSYYEGYFLNNEIEG